MKIKRIITLVLAFILIGTALVSCGKDFEAKEWAETNEKTKRSATYKELNDEKYYEIDVKGKIDMSISVSTVAGGAFFAEIYNVKTQDSPVFVLLISKNDQGALVAKVKTADGETEQTLESMTYNYTLTIAGDKDEYVIHIKGQDHTGSFVFDW